MEEEAVMPPTVDYKCPICEMENFIDVESDRRWTVCHFPKTKGGTVLENTVHCEFCHKRVRLVFKLIRVEKGR